MFLCYLYEQRYLFIYLFTCSIMDDVIYLTFFMIFSLYYLGCSQFSFSYLYQLVVPAPAMIEFEYFIKWGIAPLVLSFLGPS